MKIINVTAEQIRRLRYEVLRKGKPFSTTKYLRDNDKETFHLACLLNRKIVSCATFYPEENNKVKARKGFRLRGMATKKDHRNKGFGKKIMIKAFREILKKKGDLIWCNARIAAVDFYKKIGMKKKGEIFDILDIGPHYFMYKKI